MKLHFTPEQVELMVEVLRHARYSMGEEARLDSTMAHLCKRYCARRVAEILAKLNPEPESTDV